MSVAKRPLLNLVICCIVSFELGHVAVIPTKAASGKLVDTGYSTQENDGRSLIGSGKP